ncbi:MAG: peptide-methionine (R)-S-oxide reductase MsrB [Nitrosomonas sp.]|nr:peptide-methionine (R)-S-oxide reductase MsrB [Nitrosomonas sp.]MDP1951474.1 peptide-methionine (R)-S-oxide reductase MsrB [Nitrosomonas sp.]
MKRRTLLQSLTTLAVLPLISACSREQVIGEVSSPIVPLNKPHEAWRELVSPRAYQVLFEEETERPSTSALNYEDREGTFICAACYLPLFESAYKYESGTGWPSFTQPMAGHIATKRDFKMIVPRTEYHCMRCSGHQGHVFNDGPPPRGERWCNNGIALQFVPKEEQLPELRG